MKYNKSIVSGHLVISFDNTINGFLTVVMASVFFADTQDKIVQLLSSYAAYASMFFTSIVGALIFGVLGDTSGRKKLLMLSILGISVSVFSIGFLPSYKSIGILAPIFLITLRMIQGLFRGSEYSGILLHNYESGNKKAGDSANVVAFGCLGGAAAALICWLVTSFETYQSFTWRIPYMVGGLVAFVIFLLRRKINETDEYLEILRKNQILQAPLKEVFKNYKLEVAVGIAVTGAYSGSAYSSMMFGNRLFQQAGYSISHSMLFSFIDLVWIAASLWICGKIANKIDVKTQIKTGLSLIAFCAFPLCALISGELTLLKIYIYMFIITFLSASILSGVTIYTIKIFPANCRYSGFVVCDSIGSIIGGITPFMMLLFSSLFNSNLGCATWFVLIVIPAMVTILMLEKKQRRQGVFV